MIHWKLPCLLGVVFVVVMSRLIRQLPARAGGIELSASAFRETLSCDRFKAVYPVAGRVQKCQPKQILEIYRLLCGGKGAPYEQLCQLFDTKTSNGADMSHYSDLLGKSVQSIAETFCRRTAAVLQSGRGALIVPKSEQPEEDNDFELITWLVLQELTS